MLEVYKVVFHTVRVWVLQQTKVDFERFQILYTDKLIHLYSIYFHVLHFFTIGILLDCQSEKVKFLLRVILFIIKNIHTKPNRVLTRQK